MGRGATGNAGGLEGQDFELRGDFDSVSAPGVAVLGIDIAGGLQGLGLPQLIPKNLVIISVSTRDAEQPNLVSRSFALLCIVVIKAARKTKKRPFERA